MEKKIKEKEQEAYSQFRSEKLREVEVCSNIFR